MDRLIVIAAPSCCGKSVFTQKLQTRELPEISKNLGIEDISDWTYQDAYFVTEKSNKRLSSSATKNVLLHWTIPHPTLRVLVRNFLLRLDYDRKERTDLLHMAKHVTLVSLYANTNTLLKRVALRERRIVELRNDKQTSQLRYLQQLHGTGGLKKFYSTPNAIVELYEGWFAFCDKLNTEQQLLIDVSGTPVLHPQTDWPNIKKRWQP